VVKGHFKVKWRFTDTEREKINGDQIVEPFFAVSNGNLIYRRKIVLLERGVIRVGKSWCTAFKKKLLEEETK
jgi:hypothetical protein